MVFFQKTTAVEEAGTEAILATKVVIEGKLWVKSSANINMYYLLAIFPRKL